MNKERHIFTFRPENKLCLSNTPHPAGEGAYWLLLKVKRAMLTNTCFPVKIKVKQVQIILNDRQRIATFRLWTTLWFHCLHAQFQVRTHHFQLFIVTQKFLKHSDIVISAICSASIKRLSSRYTSNYSVLCWDNTVRCDAAEELDSCRINHSHDLWQAHE